MERWILHCDCNSFFASVELLDRPDLDGKPVAVCGDPSSRHGIILAKNEEAKRFHIQTAETVYSALQKCPDLQLLPAHYKKYSRMSRVINTIYGRYTDLVEPFGIDESWLDITHSWQLFGACPLDVANEIRQTVRMETGISISVGVSFNKVFAKLGSDYKKPDATTLLSRENFKRLVWPLPVDSLLYVGKKSQQVLAQMHIKNIGQLAAANEGELRTALGKLGPTLRLYALGEEDAPVHAADFEDEVKSVGNGLTFSRNLIGLDDIKAGVFALADSVASRLRKQGLLCRTVSVQIKDAKLQSISRQTQLTSASHLAREISQAAVELICANWDLRTPIRMLTITAMNLIAEGENTTQLSLFESEKPSDKKREHLEKSLDAIRQKYGYTAIAPGSAVKNDIGIREIENTSDDE